MYLQAVLHGKVLLHQSFFFFIFFSSAAPFRNIAVKGKCRYGTYPLLVLLYLAMLIKERKRELERYAKDSRQTDRLTLSLVSQ